MKTGWKIAVFLGVLGVLSARADACAALAATMDSVCAPGLSESQPKLAAPGWETEEISLQDIRQADQELAEQSQGERPERQVELRPPSTGSAALFLMYACGWGFWRISRSAGRLNLANAPDWFHTEAPAQIGHSVISDLDFGRLAVVQFEPTIPVVSQRIPREPPRAAWQDQCTLGVIPTRGPPATI